MKRKLNNEWMKTGNSNSIIVNGITKKVKIVNDEVNGTDRGDVSKSSVTKSIINPTVPSHVTDRSEVTPGLPMMNQTMFKRVASYNVF
jgi:hypothetical protein